MEHNFFPQRPAVTPTIYAYRLPGVESHKGYLKIGYTNRTAQERIEEQLHTSKIKYEIVLVKSQWLMTDLVLQIRTYTGFLKAKDVID